MANIVEQTFHLFFQSIVERPEDWGYSWVLNHEMIYLYKF